MMTSPETKEPSEQVEDRAPAIHDISMVVPKRGRDWMDFMTLVVTSLGLVILAFYTYFTAQQLGVNQRALVATNGALAETRRSNAATEKSNQIAQQSLELGTRAWLVVSPKSDTTVSWPSPTTIEITNVGGTPASEVVVRYSVKYAKTIPKSIHPETSFPGRAVIGPRSQADPPRKAIYYPVNEILQAVHEKRLILFLYVKIEYRDYFGKPRMTTACWEYMPDVYTWKTAALHNSME